MEDKYTGIHQLTRERIMLQKLRAKVLSCRDKTLTMTHGDWGPLAHIEVFKVIPEDSKVEAEIVSAAISAMRDVIDKRVAEIEAELDSKLK